MNIALIGKTVYLSLHTVELRLERSCMLEIIHSHLKIFDLEESLDTPMYDLAPRTQNVSWPLHLAYLRTVCLYI